MWVKTGWIGLGLATKLGDWFFHSLIEKNNTLLNHENWLIPIAHILHIFVQIVYCMTNWMLESSPSLHALHWAPNTAVLTAGNGFYHFLQSRAHSIPVLDANHSHPHPHSHRIFGSNLCSLPRKFPLLTIFNSNDSQIAYDAQVNNITNAATVYDCLDNSTVCCAVWGLASSWPHDHSIQVSHVCRRLIGSLSSAESTRNWHNVTESMRPIYAGMGFWCSLHPILL